ARQRRYITCGAGVSRDTGFNTGFDKDFATGFATSFATGFTARCGTAFRARAARRGARRDVRVALIRLLSIPRRAGFIFFCYSKLRLAPFDNHPVARTLFPRLRAQSRKSPGSLWVVGL